MAIFVTMDTNRTFYMKDFIERGYKKTQVHTVIRTRVFRGLESGQGYANIYGLNQAVFILIGCELLRTGMSARHVDQVLFQLSNFDFAKNTEVSLKKKSFVRVFPIYTGEAFRQEITRKFRTGQLRKRKQTFVGKNLVTGEYIPEDVIVGVNSATGGMTVVRAAPIQAMFIAEDEKVEGQKEGFITYIRVNVYLILQSLLR